jgi:hypothetical protein
MFGEEVWGPSKCVRRDDVEMKVVSKEQFEFGD